MKTRRTIRQDAVLPLFWLCWFAYFAANLGRLSYTSSIAIILRAEGISSAMGGLIGTGFFICYGVGQLFSGYLGDKVEPSWMILTGLVLTALCNAAFALTTSVEQMIVIWSFNGIIQSMLWPPVLRIITEKMPAAYQKKACVNIATTYPIATLVAYLLSALVAASQLWRMMFFITAALLICSVICWRVFYPRLTAGLPAEREMPSPKEPDIGERRAVKRHIYPVAAILLFIGSLIIQGALRDGLMTWIPTFMADTYHLSVATATLSTIIIPVVNMAGVYGTNLIYRRYRSEPIVSGILFALAFIAGMILSVSSQMILSLIAFALITACMMGINLMFVSFVPTYFGEMRKVAFFSGLTNAMVYLGSCFSTYGFGLIADVFGWPALLMALTVLALVGMMLSFCAVPFWHCFAKRAR